MWEKIKSAIRIFFHGMTGSFWGLLGAVLIIVSLCFCIGLFMGTVNVQSYIRNRRSLVQTDARIEALTKQLDKINLHIKLLQEHSPDFISEMGIKHLNLGDPKIMIIRK